MPEPIEIPAAFRTFENELASIESGFFDRSGLAIDALSRRVEIQIRQWINQGWSEQQIYEALARDLDTGGRIFRNVFSELDEATQEVTHATLNAVQVQREAERRNLTYDQAQAEEWTWICALINTCPDCLTRHGQTLTRAEWIKLGLPGSGWSVCGGYCVCILEPTRDLRADGIKPEELQMPVLKLQKDLASGEITGKKLIPIEDAFKRMSAKQIVEAQERVKQMEAIPAAQRTEEAKRISAMRRMLGMSNRNLLN